MILMEKNYSSAQYLNKTVSIFFKFSLTFSMLLVSSITWTQEMNTGNKSITKNIWKNTELSQVMVAQVQVGFKLPHSYGKAAIVVLIIIFWDFLIFIQIFLSPQVKQSVINSNKHDIYELPYYLPNDLRLRILENP